MPAPFKPKDFTQIHARPRLTAAHANSVVKKIACLAFATIMKPMGQVITWSIVPRQIQRKTAAAAPNFAL
jgi:hypothetical protein